MATRASPWATGRDGFGRTQWEGPEEGSSLSSPVPSRLTRSLPPHCAAPTRLPLATARLDAHVPQSLGETPPGETLQGASRGGAGLGPPTEGEPSSERRGRRRGESSGRAVGEGRSSTLRPQGSEGGQRMRSDPMGGSGAGEPVRWDPRVQVFTHRTVDSTPLRTDGLDLGLTAAGGHLRAMSGGWGRRGEAPAAGSSAAQAGPEAGGRQELEEGWRERLCPCRSQDRAVCPSHRTCGLCWGARRGRPRIPQWACEPTGTAPAPPGGPLYLAGSLRS